VSFRKLYFNDVISGQFFAALPFIYGISALIFQKALRIPDSFRNFAAECELYDNNMADDSKERYINPYTDFGFKKLFGTEMNKDLLISFLNALFHDEQVIKDVKYLNSEKLGEGYGDRKAIFDVYCENEEGEKFIVLEMPKFNKTEDQLENMFDKWLFVLRNLSRLLERPAALQERVFEKLFKQAEIAKFTPKERQDYEESVKIYRDPKNSIDTAAWKKQVEIAKNFKAMGLANERLLKAPACLLEKSKNLALTHKWLS